MQPALCPPRRATPPDTPAPNFIPTPISPVGSPWGPPQLAWGPLSQGFRGPGLPRCGCCASSAGRPPRASPTRAAPAKAKRPGGFVDADWASGTYSRRGIGGYVFMINGRAVSWTAKQQSCIAHSSAEGEFMAASKASLEANWLRRLLKSCGAPQPRATTIYQDNRACQLMSQSPAHRERSKHIDLHVYSLKE